jgi:hypothetical protein
MRQVPAVPALLFVTVLCAAAHGAPNAASEPYRLPEVDLSEKVIWGSECTNPDGLTLAFGGLDQDALEPPGDGGTRVRQPGAQALQRVTVGPDDHPAWSAMYRCRTIAWSVRQATACARRDWFDGRPPGHLTVESWRRPTLEFQGKTMATADRPETRYGPYADEVARLARRMADMPVPTTAEQILAAHAIAVEWEQFTDALWYEPSPRALSPIVWEPESKRFVLFGGDHLDYLTNDLWLFDPKTFRWERRTPPAAPEPRANHTLRALGGGKIELTGGYAYANNTDYMGGQYVDHGDGPFVYDVGADRWTAADAGQEKRLTQPNRRVYRTGPFHPRYFLEGPAPDPVATGKRLADLPVNTWVKMDPPRLPQLNRDWGTAVRDPGNDLLLRWAGGHSAHGGTDVLHYHCATNRWELPFPVEFPLGQLYTNTNYPRGVSFNRRPWITGHTYQNYGMRPADGPFGSLLYVGQPELAFSYTVMWADWDYRPYHKPKGMVYDSCFYTLTCVTIGNAVYVWTGQGELYGPDWIREERPKDDNLGRVPVRGKLPEAVVDNSTVVFDEKRNRLLFFRKPYGDEHRYDGRVQTLDMETLEVGELTPAGAGRAGDIPYLCQIRRDPRHDLLLVCGTLPPDGGAGLRRTPAYDCANDRWVSLKITGDDPSGEDGREVSVGMVYDQQRNLFWATDAASQVFVLKLDPATADVRPLR